MLAIIGGSGLSQLSSMADMRPKVVRTPYGEPSGALTFGSIRGKDVVFLARHGYGHTIAPHEVNYRANLWALKEEKVAGVVSVASVGGIRKDLGPGTLLLPDQIIDYTWGRRSTFFEGASSHCAAASSRRRAPVAKKFSSGALMPPRRGRAWRPPPRSTAWSATARTWSA